MSKAEKSVSK
jgi:hypothetical protein